MVMDQNRDKLSENSHIEQNMTTNIELRGATKSASVLKTTKSDKGDRPACFKTTIQECLFVLTTTMAIGQSSIFGGAILCMTSYIGNELNMNAAEVTWITAGQYLSAGTFLLFFGRVADIFGRRILLISSLAFFTIGLIVIGFAKSAIYMDIFSALLGLSCAASVPPAIGKLGAVYETPSQRKNRAFACFSAGNPVGFVIGAFIAGVTMQISSWRTTFWVMAVIYGFITIFAWWTVPDDKEQQLQPITFDTLLKFDLFGAILAIAGLGMFTASLTLSGQSTWTNPLVISLFVVGGLLTILFIGWESICTSPLMPLNVWKDRNFSLLVVTLCLGFYGFSGNLFWLTLSWQRIQHTSPLMIAIKLLPAGIGGIIINIIAGLIMHRVSNKLIMIIGAISLIAASTLLSVTSINTYWSLTFPALILSVIGCDFEFTITNMYVMSSLPSEKQSIAGGLFNTVSRLSVAIGLAIQTSIYDAVGGSAQKPGALLYRPYQTTFWFSLGGAVICLALVPFLTVGFQGGKKDD